MKIFDDLNELVSDQQLAVIILILTAVIGLIPLFTTVIKQETVTTAIKSKKTKALPTKKELTKSGKWFLFIFGIVLLCSIWKNSRDSKIQDKLITLQDSIRDTVNVLNNVVGNLSSNFKQANNNTTKQFKQDSTSLSIIQKNLGEKGYLINSDLKIVHKPLIDLTGAKNITFSNFSIDGTGMSPLNH